MRVGLAKIESGNSERAAGLDRSVSLCLEELERRDWLPVTTSVRSPSEQRFGLFASILQVIASFVELRNHQKFCRGSFQISAWRLVGLVCNQVFSPSVPKTYRLIERVRIESEVSEKHLRAYGWAVEQELDLLFVFEDDVVPAPGSKGGLSELMSILADTVSPDSGYVFVDIAGGYEFNRLPKSRWSTVHPGVAQLSVPQTNTAAGYVMNNHLFTAISRFVASDQMRAPFVGIDFLLNKIMRQLWKESESFECLHFNPSVFSHGSMDGTYSSWDL